MCFLINNAISPLFFLSAAPTEFSSSRVYVCVLLFYPAPRPCRQQKGVYLSSSIASFSATAPGKRNFLGMCVELLFFAFSEFHAL